MNRNKPGIIKRILNALERFIARIRGKDAYLAVEQRQAAERLRDMLTGELKRAYGTEVKGEAAVESGEGKRHSLAGANSRTADLNSLGGAYQMYQNGVSMDTIRKRTGWWLGKDGKWRYEISDKEMRFNPEGYVDNPQTVGDYVKHDRLFAAYPWVKKINLKFVDEIDGRESLNGKYNRDNDTVYLKNGRTAEQMKSTLIHEIQHAIQVNEEFATGANQKAAAAYLFNITYDKLKNNPKFAGIKSPKDKMHLLKQYVERTTGKTFSEQANYYYYVNYGEQESRAVQKRLAQNEDSDVARIENELFYNGGENYDSAYEIKKSIDNLREMGYTEKQIDRIKKGGIQNDNLSENASQSSLSQESWGRYLHGEDKQSGGYGRTGRMELGVQRGGEIQGSQTGSSGLRVLRVLNEVSKPEKRFSLASSADTVAELQREETELTNRIREIEKSDAFKKANDDLSKAINSDNIAEGMKAYQDWRKESGYADLVDRRDALRADIEKSSESGSGRASAGELAAIEKSGLSEADYFRKQAVKEFGYTPYFYDAGYIMPNGKMLNFSGEKGQHYGSRGEDHRAIGAIYENTEGTDALVRFMNDGNIRIMAETPGLDISASTEPSKEQYTTIRRFANEYADGGYFAVDLSDENGKTVGTLEYEGNINPTRIVNDIKHFYETGEVREQSGLDRFRYSLTRANDEYMKAVESGNVEEQQRLVDEAAENAGYDTVLYHGTQSFGFTQIDVSKYSDDGMSFFATSNPEMAQTYSAKSGTREISRKSGIENLSLPQVVDRLNAVAAADTSDYDRYTYRIMNRSDTETLKKSIQSGIKELRAETERLISEYADRLAKDFNGEDELKHSRLRSLLNALDSDSASKLSANLYTVLNHNEIFDDAAKVKFGNLEADIRLLKKLAALKTDEDVVVREDTDRYDIVVEDQEKARNRLEKLDNSGNYVLRGRTEGFLEIDGNGHNWNAIFTTLEPKGGNTLKAEYDFGSESLKLSDRDGEFAVIPAKSVADAVSPMARAFARRYGTTFATTVLAQTKDQLKNSATAEVKIKSTGKTNTRDIANFAREQGYPGVKITDIYDNGGRGSEAGRGDVYIFFNPEQDVKSADPITYDDSGNVVPLTERFDSGNRDIRWSLAGNSGITTEITDDSYDEYEGGYQRRDIKLNGETVGTVAIRIYDDYSEIDRIDIDEKYRNKGIGTTVLGDIAGEFDTTYIVPDNESAKRLYERIGEEVTSGEVYENLDQGYGVYRLDKSYGNTRWSLAGTNKDKAEAAEFSDSGIRYSLRKEDPPKKTLTGYKVFVVKNGKLYPPMVANPDAADTPVGVWLNADIGAQAPDSKTGRKQVKAGGKGTQGRSGSLAFRPGWHLGETPLATQFDRTNPETGKRELFPENFVWAECEIAADKNYQEEAMSYGYTKSGKFQHSLAGLPKLPIDGYYKYRTNPNPDTVPWLITGAMKVTRLLGDAEVNRILESKGLPPKNRVGGNKTLADLGLEETAKRLNGDGNIRYSLSANAAEEIKKALADKNYSSEIKLTDTTPTIMLGHNGVKNLPLMMRATHLRENILTREQAKAKGLPTNPGINYHGLGEPLFLDAIADLDNVKEAYRGTQKSPNSDRRENYFLLISEKIDASGNTINIPVFINETAKYNNVFMDVNKAATVFGREQLRKYINRKLADGSLVRIKRRSIQSSEVSSPIEPHYRKNASSIDNSVSQNDPVVNTQSMQDVEKDSSDERHSLVKSAQSELKALQKENEKLRQDVDDLKQELQLTHGRKLSRDALISSIQKILIDGYGVKLSAKELYPHVTNLYDMFYNNTVDGKRLKKDERVDTMRIIEEMDKIVDAVIENAVGVDDTYVEMKKLLPELRNTKLVVPMDARADAAQSAGFENWAEFRKANFGRVGFANEGLPVVTATRAMIRSTAWNF